MVDEVRREIERIRGYISSGRLTQFDEANTKATAIEPILRELGWDVADPDEVRREYSVGSRSVDYALFCDDTLKVFIEAKRGGELLERHHDQLVRYAFDEGVEIAMLTNGTTWWFYLPLQEGSWEQTRIGEVEFQDQNATEITQRLGDLLSRENVSSENAIQNAENLQKRNKILEALPQAWEQLVNNKIPNLLAAQAQELCGHKPSRNEVEQFLSAHLQHIQITPHPALDPPLEPNQSLGPSSSGSVTGKKPVAFTFDGSRYEVTSWKEMFVRLCEIVHSAHRDRFEEVLTLKAKTRPRPIFSRNGDRLIFPAQINGTDIFVESHGSAEMIDKRAKDLIVNFGYDKDNLSFETQTP